MHAHLPLRPSRESQASGFTLIEIMVAMLLMAVGLLGVAAAFIPGRQSIHIGNQTTTAVALARETLEAMRNRPFDTDEDEITAGNFPNQAYGAIPQFPAFRRTITIANDTPAVNLKRVTVTVFYRDGGTDIAVPLTTLFLRSE